MTDETNKKKEYKETDKGFVKKDKIDHIEFETIVQDQGWEEIRDRYKVPFSCHACGKLMNNWDTQFHHRYGVCGDCAVDYVEERDLSPELLKDRPALLKYVKEAIQEKANRTRE